MFRALFETSITAAALATALQSWALQFCVVLAAGVLFAILRRWMSVQDRDSTWAVRSYLRSACIAYAISGLVIIAFVVIRLHAWSRVTADDLLQFLLERRNFILIGIFDDCALLILVALELWRPVVRVPGNQRTVVPRSLGRAVGLACAGIIITVVVQRLFNSTASPARISQAAQELGPHSLGRLLWQAWLVLVAPVSEELYFRKLLFTLYKSVSGRTVALCLQALAFVAMHGQMTGQLASIAVAALVLGMIYEATGAILLPMLVHSLLNLLAVLRMA